ncbi:MAG: phosphatidylglycerophosphatase A [Acidobacteriota bacterium]|nr:phosphatidylglycerophosphatase A [Acidobacteriota bacterium]
MAKKIINFLVYHLATGFGSGRSPIAPGTMGTAVGVILYVLFFPMEYFNQLIFVVVSIAIAVYAAGWLAESEGVKDPQIVVADEIVGIFTAFLWLPYQPDWLLVLAGFVIFRIFDIWKPRPIKDFESLPGGYGIVLDDVMAGVCTNIILQIWMRFLLT